MYTTQNPQVVFPQGTHEDPLRQENCFFGLPGGRGVFQAPCKENSGEVLDVGMSGKPMQDLVLVLEQIRHMLPTLDQNGSPENDV